MRGKWSLSNMDGDSRPRHHSTTRRRSASFARALCAASALLLLAPGLALAHLGLSRSTPGKGAHLSTAPRELRLTFTEPVEIAVVRLRLLGPAGAEVPISAVRQAGDSARVLIADVTGSLEAGPHTIEWQVIGKDGHPVRGTIAFVIAPGATGLGPLPGDVPAAGDPAASATAPAGDDTLSAHHDPTSLPMGDGFDAASAGYVIVRWLQFTALLAAIGAVVFSFAVLGRLRRTETQGDIIPAMRSRAAAVGFWASVSLLGVVFLRLYAQSLAMHGPGEALSGTFIATMLMNTVWGWGWMLQVSAAMLAITAFALARRRRSMGWPLAAVACLALAATPALSGHAAATPGLTGLAIASDTLHVIGAAGWLGSLLLLLAVGIPVAMRLDEGSRGPAVARLVNAFSPTALMFAGLAGLTGVFAAWLHIGVSSALWESDYGQMLLRKLVVLSVVLATGAYNWLKVKPTLGNDIGARRIGRSAAVELAVGVVVLIITAVLVATPPPREMRDQPVGGLMLREDQ